MSSIDGTENQDLGMKSPENLERGDMLQEFRETQCERIGQINASLENNDDIKALVNSWSSERTPEDLQKSRQDAVDKSEEAWSDVIDIKFGEHDGMSDNDREKLLDDAMGKWDSSQMEVHLYDMALERQSIMNELPLDDASDEKVPFSTGGDDDISNNEPGASVSEISAPENISDANDDEPGFFKKALVGTGIMLSLAGAQEAMIYQLGGESPLINNLLENVPPIENKEFDPSKPDDWLTVGEGLVNILKKGDGEAESIQGTEIQTVTMSPPDPDKDPDKDPNKDK